MKFPSFSNVVKGAIDSFLSFPLALLCSFAAAIFLVFLLGAELTGGNTVESWWNLTTSAYLAVVLLIATDVYAERVRISAAASWLLRFVVIGCVLVFYFSLPPDSVDEKFYRFILFAVSFHLMVSFLPFIGISSMNGFWQYNKILFLRFLNAALFGMVLYAGLATAFLSLKLLFGVDIPEEFFLDLLYMVCGIFMTWYFVAGIPHNFGELETVSDYPKGLKVFSQYILLPLVSVYLIILVAYSVKILVTGNWPSGWVVYLVVYFSFFGILAMLLGWPKRNDPGQRWNRIASQAFYIALVPLSVLLLVSITRRLSQYGVTVHRYFILVLGCWLLLVGIYFIFSKVKNIRLIPLSLCLICLLISFGPQGAFQVSQKSQKERLLQFLEKNKMLSDGKVIAYQGKLTGADKAEINSIVFYLVSVHGHSVLKDIFSCDLDSLVMTEGKEPDVFEKSKAILKYMNIDYMEPDFRRAGPGELIFESKHEHMIGVSGYDYCTQAVVLGILNSRTLTIVKSIDSGKDSLKIKLDTLSGRIELKFASRLPISFNLDSLAKTLESVNISERRSVEERLMTFENTHDGFGARMIIRQLETKHPRGRKMDIQEVRFDLMVKIPSDSLHAVGE